ncbi:MAG TPA: PilZ domain-containing protein [Nitrospiria bacterium]|jgi:uncharacterized protein (TIGR02266 family)
MRQAQGTAVKKKAPQKLDGRISPRLPLLVLEVRGEHGKKVFLGYAENISQGGLFVSAKTPLIVGERFPVEFVLPDNKTMVRATCEVVWRRNYGKNDLISGGMGIKFVDLNNKAKQVIGAWIQQEDHRKKRKP